jgi:hypothetical protein
MNNLTLPKRLKNFFFIFTITIVLAGCTRSGSIAFNSVDGQADENARKLMSLSVGMQTRPEKQKTHRTKTGN